MPRYLVVRRFDVAEDEMPEVGKRSRKTIEEGYPEITWEHTHVVRTPEGFKAFCVYESPDPDSVKNHAAALGLPVERFYEVETDLSP